MAELVTGALPMSMEPGAWYVLVRLAVPVSSAAESVTTLKVEPGVYSASMARLYMEPSSPPPDWSSASMLVLS